MSILLSISFIACSSNSDDPEIPKPEPPEPPVETTTITLNVATYNLRLLTSADTGDKAWIKRKVYADKIIKKYDFDIFGTQELVYSQITDLLALSSSYGYLGVGRDNGTTTGEFSAIFYKKNKFEVLEQGTFWLSQTPDTPSKGWDASLNRICTWAKFKEKESKKEFYFFNTHFDHVGTIARKESSKLILQKMKAIAKDSPAICTGDFNLEPNAEAILTLVNSNYVWDSRTVSKTPASGTEGTFHGYDLNKDKYSRIDYIFITKDVKVQSYGVINDDIELNAFSSDHFPVLVKAEF